ncbi:hypothetical protein [Bacillus sp. EB600]|uniref:hypothetical protein n=1 Tax=Bacillus sp. EB600 TaxID=2806345 RepID=UPI00210A15E9|nr:hypothetical protein [Bacillus sp. EB600]MCQ6280902.1 hypothetical protein [Bacillus sp. EB600]
MEWSICHLRHQQSPTDIEKTSHSIILVLNMYREESKNVFPVKINPLHAGITEHVQVKNKADLYIPFRLHLLRLLLG